MSKAASTQRWFAGWRAERRPAAADPADQGTAWGLDMSLIESTVEPPARPAPGRRGWAQRLGLVRKPAT